MATLALAYCVLEGNADHYQSPWSVDAGWGAWFTAGLAGSDRWPSSTSGDEMVGAPATGFHRDLGGGFPHGGPRAQQRRPEPDAVARTGAIRRADGPAGAKGGDTLRRCPVAIMWPPAYYWPQFH